jgi:predicted RND superfamily exporter protein
LIVEFANQARDLGMNITQAAIFASEQRLRPILMTAISSLVGFAPLLGASGAGAISRWSLGTAIFGGLAFATVLSLVLVPVLYIVVKSFDKNILKDDQSPPSPPPSSPDSQGTPINSLEDAPSEVESIPTFKASPQNE